MRYIFNEQKNNTIRERPDGDKKGVTTMNEREPIDKKSNTGTKVYKSEHGVIIGDTTPLNPKVKPSTQAPSTPIPKKQ